jgi:hypothetical protein
LQQTLYLNFNSQFQLSIIDSSIRATPLDSATAALVNIQSCNKLNSRSAAVTLLNDSSKFSAEP